MHIKSAIDLGRMVRLSRNQKGWSQTELAEKLGTSQRWVSEIENGKSRAELGRVLKCLRALDVTLEARIGPDLPSTIGRLIHPVRNINNLLKHVKDMPASDDSDGKKS